MNYDGFSQLCRDNGTTPTALTQKLGLSKGNTSSWKRGGNPSVDILMQLSVELNCTTDFLLGLTTEPVPILTKTKELHPLMQLYNEMNADGQARLMDYAHDLSSLPKYKKCDSLPQNNAL